MPESRRRSSKGDEMLLTLTMLGNRLRQARINCGLTQEEAAEAIGIPRTALLQIEAGHRNVTSLELVSLSKLYHRDVSVLLAETEEDENLLIALCRVRAEFADNPGLKRRIVRYLDIFREGIELEKLLGDRRRAIAPAYEFPEPRNYAEAVKQGEATAIQERKRLNLGNGPIADVAEVISNQGIWACAATLPNDLSSLFLHHPSIGMAIVVNDSHVRGRRRFSYAHEYGHALADRMRLSASVTGKHNAHELVERRANAFAGEFLMPAGGVAEVLDRFDKGAANRELFWLWDVANESGEPFEKRNAPGSQTIGYQDVAFLAHEFIVSYDTAVYRLSDMGVIGRAEVEGLLENEKRSQATRLIHILKLLNPDEKEKEQPRLVRQIGFLAVEAYRREIISGGRLLDICEKIGIEGQELLSLAQGTR